VEDASMEAWGLGCATVVMIGLLKFVLAIFGNRIHHLFHAAGKQGALAAIGKFLFFFLDYYGYHYYGILYFMHIEIITIELKIFSF
jgi:hypothetical protein